MTTAKLRPPGNRAPAGGEHGMGPGPALLIWACSLLLMGLLSFAFVAFPTHSVPTFVATVAVIAVFLPAAGGFGWMLWRGEGQLPRYTPPPLHVMSLVLLISLPLYALSAALLTRLGDVRLEGAPSLLATPWYAWVGLWGAYALLPAVGEELLYRGLLQPAIGRRWGVTWGIGLTAVLFALTHMEPAGIIPRVLMGIWFGYLAWRTGSLWSCTGAHILNNTWGVLYLTFYSSITAHPGWVLASCLVSLGMAFWVLKRVKWEGTEPSHEKHEMAASVRLVPVTTNVKSAEADVTAAPPDSGTAPPPQGEENTPAG